MHTHIRGLKSLAERLEGAIDLIASDGTISLEQLEFFEWKLLSALDQLRRRLAAERGLDLEVPRSSPRTS
jgi:hypothetical protein